MTPRPRFRGKASRRRMAGLSIIELMISVTIGLIILTAIALVFSNASRTRNELERISRQIENGRYAIDLLSDDLRQTGFYGELSVGALTGTTTPAVSTPGAMPDPCLLTAASFRAAIPLSLQGYSASDGTGASSIDGDVANDLDFAAVAPTCLPSSLGFQPGSDIIVVRRARTCVAGATDCDAAVDGKPYLQVSLCATQNDLFALGIRGTDPMNVILKKACGASIADLRQYLVHIYYVSTNNGLGSNVPTLKRLSLDLSGGSLAMVGESLVEGIERLHLEYGLDTTGDGAPDVYVANPNNYPVAACNAACRVANWMNVMTVQMYVVARNLEASQDYAGDSKSYQLGTLAYTPAAADRVYRRHVYQALVRIANPSNRRDTP